MRFSHLHLHRRANDANVEDPRQLEERVAVIKTVYVTAEATFEGEVGYSTIREVEPTKASKNDDTSKEETKTTAEPKAQPKATKAAASDEEETSSATKTKFTKESLETNESESTTKSSKTTKTRSTKEESASIPTAIIDPTHTGSIDTVLAKATGQVSISSSSVASISTTSAVSSSTPTAEASTSGGTSAGVKAGIAFGVLGGVFMVGVLVFLVFSRRRKQAENEKIEDDEKFDRSIDGGVFAGAMATTPRTNPKAPRISLRPVSQFFGIDKRNSKGAALALAVPSSNATASGLVTSRATGGSAWERPTSPRSADPNNPFGVQAERIPSPIMEESIHARSTAPSPVPSHNEIRPVSPLSSVGTIPTSEAGVAVSVPPGTAIGTAIGTAAGATAGAAAAAAVVARKASMRKDGPKHIDLTVAKSTAPLSPVPASPAGTEFSISSAAPGASEASSSGAAAIAAAGGPANSAVHRVQLDFKPTMDDEMGLNAGELVRLLHEYDDGWALCIRLDRSRQGVVPRTCLSTRPVKPRPNGPPGQRPMTPQGGRSASPAGLTLTPNGARPASPAGRPMTPTGGRSQSPMNPNRARSQSPGPRPQSPNGPGRRNIPSKPSPMNPNHEPAQDAPQSAAIGRKPVPGQAY